MAAERATDRGAGPDDSDLVISRVLDAPRDLVFRAWVEPDHFARWFGPRGSTVPFCELDPTPGGTLHFCQRFPGGDPEGVVRPGHASGDVWVKGVYREVVEPERLVFTTYFSDEAGARVERPGFSQETQVDVSFTEHEGRTTVTIRHSGLIADQGELQGWTESMDRLEVHLGSRRTAREPRKLAAAKLLRKGSSKWPD